MSKKQHFNSFAKRMTRWLMLSLVVTLGIVAMHDAVHEFVADAEQSDDLTMLAIQLK